MNVKFFKDYFSSYSTMSNDTMPQPERTRAKVYFASYFLLGIPPMIIAIGYAFVSACNCLSKIGRSPRRLTTLSQKKLIAQLQAK